MEFQLLQLTLKQLIGCGVYRSEDVKLDWLCEARDTESRLYFTLLTRTEYRDLMRRLSVECGYDCHYNGVIVPAGTPHLWRSINAGSHVDLVRGEENIRRILDAAEAEESLEQDDKEGKGDGSVPNVPGHIGP